MSIPVTEFIPYAPDAYTHRYAVDQETRTIRDLKYGRELVAGCRRGGRPYFRLVLESGVATHVRAEDIFGPEANEDVEFESDFDPRDFSKRYNFDLDGGKVLRLPGRGPNSGAPMTLIETNGWKHFRLLRNDGKKIYVTPSEIQKFEPEGGIWEVPLPKGARTAKLPFPDLAFTPDGKVWRVRSGFPLLRPEPVPLSKVPEPGHPDQDSQAAYLLTQSNGHALYFTRKAIKAIFKSPPNVH